MIRPKAAVDLPLPGPVLTISRPFSIVLEATSASCTALRFAIFALWRVFIVRHFTTMGRPATMKTTRSASAAIC